MLFGVGSPHREKGAGADMQRHAMARDAARLQRLHQPFGEMQAGGRRRHRSLLPREDGLIIAAVLFVGGAARGDVRRQRHGAKRGDRLVERGPAQLEAERHLPLLAAGLDRRRQAAEQAGIASIPEGDTVAELKPLGRARQGQPAGGAEPLDQSRRDLRRVAVTLARAAKLGRDHLGVVEDERIAWLKQAGKVEHRAIGERGRRGGFDHQQPRRVARYGWPERDQLLRQMIVERIDAHGETRLRGVGGDPHRQHLVRIGRRLAASDLVDILHAVDHAAPHRIFVVEKARVVEDDEELAVG